MESCLIAASTAALALSPPSLPTEVQTQFSVRPLLSVLAAQGGSYWLFSNQQDKHYHAMGCALFSSVITEVTGNPWVGFSAGIGLGIAKELLDLRFHGDPDFQDLKADLIGAGLGTLFYLRF